VCYEKSQSVRQNRPEKRGGSAALGTPDGLRGEGSMKTSKTLPAAFAILTAFSAFLVLSACHNTLANVKTELAKGGFALWYPAEAGIQPGQIWQMEGQRKDIIHDQPSGLPLWGPRPIHFESLKKHVNADLSLNADFAKGLLSNVGPLSAELKKSTVTSVSLDFGQTEVERLILGKLDDEKLLESLPDGYRSDLKKAKAGSENFVLIGAVVSTSGLKYVFTCEDTNGLAANAAQITKILGVNFNVKIVSNTEAVWEIPGLTRMAIGISPVRGKMFNMSARQNLEALSPVLLNKTLLPAEFITALENRINTVLTTDKKSEDIKREDIKK
jgi:hypothetical protein